MVVVMVTLPTATPCKLKGRIRDARTGSYEYASEEEPALRPTVTITRKEPCTPPDNLQNKVVCIIHRVTSDVENPAETAKVRLLSPNPVPHILIASAPCVPAFACLAPEATGVIYEIAWVLLPASSEVVTANLRLLPIPLARRQLIPVCECQKVSSQRENSTLAWTVCANPLPVTENISDEIVARVLYVFAEIDG